MSENILPTNDSNDDHIDHNMKLMKEKTATMQMQMLQNTMALMPHIMNHTTESPEYLILKEEMDNLKIEQERLSTKLMGYALHKMTTKLETGGGDTTEDPNLNMMLKGLTGLITKGLGKQSSGITLTEELSEEEEIDENETVKTAEPEDMLKGLMGMMAGLLEKPKVKFSNEITTDTTQRYPYDNAKPTINQTTPVKEYMGKVDTTNSEDMLKGLMGIMEGLREQPKVNEETEVDQIVKELEEGL